MISLKNTINFNELCKDVIKIKYIKNEANLNYIMNLNIGNLVYQS